jgi:hypothetical protein
MWAPIILPYTSDPPSCAYYTYELGKLSPYGDELLPVARTMAATGAFEAAQVAPAYYEFFSTYPGRYAFQGWRV